jgi:hypothetical protein
MKKIKIIFLFSVFLNPVVSFATGGLVPVGPPCSTKLSQTDNDQYLKSFAENPAFAFVKEWGAIPELQACYEVIITAKLKTPKELSKYTVPYYVEFATTSSFFGSENYPGTEGKFSSLDEIKDTIFYFEQKDQIKEFLEKFSPVATSSSRITKNSIYLATSDAKISLDDNSLSYRLPNGTDYRSFPEVNLATKIFNEANLPYGCRVNKDRKYFITLSHRDGFSKSSKYLTTGVLSSADNSKCPYAEWGVTINNDGTFLLDERNSPQSENSVANKNEVDRNVLSLFAKFIHWIRSIF